MLMKSAMRLGAWLAEKGVTQDAFAEKIGVTQGRVSQIVKGALPSLDLARRIKAATDGDVDFLETEAAQ